MRPHLLLWGVTGILLAALLAGCGGRPASRPGVAATEAPAHPPGKGYYKVGAPYQVQGVWYYPGVDYRYDETGIASWYGPDFHGKYTANGEVYNMNDVTAAHPTLPMPSIVRVTNLDNGRSIVVRVNDRGPYVRGRIIDLSRRAAQLLGMIGTGTAKVRVQILADESKQMALLARQGEIPPAERIVANAKTEKVTAQVLAPPPGVQSAPKSGLIASARATPPVSAPAIPLASVPPVKVATNEQVSVVPVRPTSIFVQVGAFSQYDNANRVRAKLSPIAPTKVSQVNVGGEPFFRVRIGPATSVTDADQLLDQMVKAGYHDARIVVE